MGSHDITMGSSGFTLADYSRQTIVDAAGLSGTYTPDFLTVDDDDPVTVIVFTGTLPLNVTIGQPLNAPMTESCIYLFRNPGVNTPTFSGYENYTNLPTWEAGKNVFYTFQRLAEDETPANDAYVLSGGIQGGQAVSASVVNLPPVGTEVAYRQHPTFGQTFLQTWEGTLTTSPQSLGGAIVGTMERLINSGGDMRPNVASGSNHQRWSMPSVVNPAELQISSGIMRIISGASVVAAVPTFSVWAETSRQ